MLKSSNAQGNQRKRQRLYAAVLGTAPLLFALASVAAGQNTPASANANQQPMPPVAVQPGPGAKEAAPGSLQPHTSRNVAQRPYTAALPAPLYPSTPRKQSQFTVQYVYNYAQSTYTPPVNLPQLSRAAVKHDTPESALTAFYSAMRSGDYEAWLQCWDPVSRKALEERTKQQKSGAEYWRTLWRQFYAGKSFILIDRIETVNYVILDAQITDPAKPASRQVDSEVLVTYQGQWYLSNAFTNDGLVMNFDPTAPTAKAVKEFEIAPTRELVGPAALSGEAQREFLAHHTTTASLTRTVE